MGAEQETLTPVARAGMASRAAEAMPLIRQLGILFVEGPVLGVACLVAGFPHAAAVVIAASGWACARVDLEQLERRGLR
jgi:hypothetical protein